MQQQQGWELPEKGDHRADRLAGTWLADQEQHRGNKRRPGEEGGALQREEFVGAQVGFAHCPALRRANAQSRATEAISTSG
jgi:hypothetical protein